jgi:hypothetical protein
LTKAAAMLPGASRVCHEFLALHEDRHGHLEHFDGRDLAVRGEAQRIKSVELRPSSLATVIVLHSRVLGAVIVLTNAVRGPDRRAATVAYDFIRHNTL